MLSYDTDLPHLNHKVTTYGNRMLRGPFSLAFFSLVKSRKHNRIYLAAFKKCVLAKMFLRSFIDAALIAVLITLSDFIPFYYVAIVAILAGGALLLWFSLDSVSSYSSFPSLPVAVIDFEKRLLVIRRRRNAPFVQIKGESARIAFEDIVSLHTLSSGVFIQNSTERYPRDCKRRNALYVEIRPEHAKKSGKLLLFVDIPSSTYRRFTHILTERLNVVNVRTTRPAFEYLDYDDNNVLRDPKSRRVRFVRDLTALSHYIIMPTSVIFIVLYIAYKILKQYTE